jgi:hypothetical protein
MAALVTLMHSPTSPSPVAPVRFIEEFICCGLTRPLMPAFFLISGYLFFGTLQNFHPKDYLGKMARKSRTLLLPYIIWCAIFSISLIVYGDIDPGPEPGSLIRLFWAGESSMYTVTPFGYKITDIAYPDGGGHLWFLRDLIVMMLLTPAIWFFARLNPKITIPIVSLAALTNAGIPGIGSTSVVWFTMGAIFGIHRIDFVRFSYRLGACVIIPWLLLGAVFAYMVIEYGWHHVTYGPKSIMVSTLDAYIGVFAYFAIASRCLYHLKKEGRATISLSEDNAIYRANNLNKILLRLAPVSFFMYVIHPLPWIDRHIRLTDYLISNPDYKETAAFVSVAILKLTLIPLLFFAMRRYTPRLLSILTGGRSSRTFQSPEKLLTLQSEKLTESPNC